MRGRNKKKKRNNARNQREKGGGGGRESERERKRERKRERERYQGRAPRLFIWLAVYVVGTRPRDGISLLNVPVRAVRERANTRWKNPDRDDEVQTEKGK